MRVCVVIPMHNEERIARDSLEIILPYVKKLPPTVTLVVVDDGSCDKTAEIVAQFTRQENPSVLQLISHPANQGYGVAIRTGIKFAVDHDYDYIVFMDSDLTNHPKYLERFYKKMKEGWDYIKASRYIEGGMVEGVSLEKRIISRIGNFVARILFGLPIKDFTNGFRAVKVDLLRRMVLTENGFVIIMEELYQAKYLTKSFSEVPYILTSRKQGQGRTHFSYGPQVCRQYFKYAWKSFINAKPCYRRKSQETYEAKK